MIHKANIEPVQRGFFSIGIFNPKRESNIGSLWRTATALGASYIFTVGTTYQHQHSDTSKAWKKTPLMHFEDIEDLKCHLPYGTQLIGIEITPNARFIKDFLHPERACYLLGREDRGLPEEAINACNCSVKLQGSECLNVSVAGSIALYDRITKGTTNWGKVRH